MDPKLDELVEHVRKYAGLEVYAHGCGRGDLNDWGDNQSYVRGVRNLKRPEKGFTSYIRDATNYIIKEPSISGKAFVDWGFLFNREFINAPNPKIAGANHHSSLSEVITTNDNTKTNCVKFLRLTINSDIHDEFGRPAGDPYVTLVGSVTLTSEVLNYLKSNPSKYMEFVKGVLPASEFPNINKGILDESFPITEIRYNCHLYSTGLGDRKTESWITKVLR